MIDSKHERYRRDGRSMRGRPAQWEAVVRHTFHHRDVLGHALCHQENRVRDVEFSYRAVYGPSMTKFGMCNEHFANRSVEDGFGALAAHGYDGVEVTPWTFTDDVTSVTDEAIADVRRAASDGGLEVIGVPRIFWAEADYHLSTDDEAIRERTRAYLVDVVDLCDRLGGDVVLFGSPNQRNVPDGMSRERAWGRAVETFRSPRLIDRLEEGDVTLCMEPLSPQYTDFVTSAEEGAAFVDAVDHPNVGLSLDGFHLAVESDPAADVLRQYGGELRHFHADNTAGRGPRHGDLDYGPVVEALGDIKYDGYVSIELHADILPLPDSAGEFDPDKVAADSITFLEEVFDAN